MRAAGVAAEIIDVPGPSVLAQMLWAVQFGDFVSYYLGLLYGVDPSEVRALEWMKDLAWRGGAVSRRGCWWSATGSSCVEVRVAAEDDDDGRAAGGHRGLLARAWPSGSCCREC